MHSVTDSVMIVWKASVPERKGEGKKEGKGMRGGGRAGQRREGRAGEGGKGRGRGREGERAGQGREGRARGEDGRGRGNGGIKSRRIKGQLFHVQ